MTWIPVLWLMMASACVTLAGIHMQVWLRDRRARASVAFAALALGVGVAALIELRLLSADTPDEFGRLLWWWQVPVWSSVVSLVAFVRLHMKVGRAWLGWLAVGLRTLVLLVNTVSTPNINYREIVAVEKVTIFGDAVTVAVGSPNPWMVVAQLSLLVLIVFVIDAARTLWKRGDRRRAVVIGCAFAGFVVAGTLVAIVSFWGLVRIPAFFTLFFLPIVLGSAFELGRELAGAVRLSTELQEKTVALRAAERRVALAADAADAGLWSIDHRSGHLWATPKALAMFGLEPGEDHDIEAVFRAIHPDDRQRVRASLAAALYSHGSMSVEYRVRRPDGSPGWYLSLAGPGGDPQDSGGAGSQTDARTSLMGATIDISDRKHATDEAASYRAELAHLSRVATVSELSGALAHELNQPLAIIMSNAEAAQRMLEQPSPDLAEIRAMLDDIVDADERAGQVIRRLRRLLRRGAPDRQALSLDAVVHGVLRLLNAELIRRGVVVETTASPGLATVVADRVAIEQVLLNLIGNACDAMAGNEAGARRIGIDLWNESGEVRLRVTDTGVGLPDPPERIFDAFYTTKQEGLGLGLALSRSIVGEEGGRLWAERNPAGGARLCISLPAQGPTT
jgi:PAS domain-containing protein